MTNEIKIDAFLASDSDMRQKKKTQNQKTCFKENICYASQYPEKLVKPREEEKRTHT